MRAMHSRLRRCSLALLLFAAAIAACGPTTPEEEPVPCEVVAPTQCVEPSPTWADVAPIFEKSCASCHDGERGSPWPLDTYSHVADWWDVIRDELIDCSMPPSDADEPLPPADRDTLLMWLRCGFPE